MSEITRRRQGELVRGVFKLLLSQPEGIPAKEILQNLVELVPPTAFEESTYPNRPNVRRYERIVRFSTISAVKAGWLVKDKGTWLLTDAGREAYRKFKDPEEFRARRSGCTTSGEQTIRSTTLLSLTGTRW